jgi:transposase
MAREFIARNPAGGRFRMPPLQSKHNPYFIADRKRAVCTAILSGKDRKTIAEEHKISERTVKRYLKENNIQPRKEKADTLEERIKLALRLGKKVTEIAKDEGLSRTRIYQIMDAKGIKKK